MTHSPAPARPICEIFVTSFVACQGSQSSAAQCGGDDTTDRQGHTLSTPQAPRPASRMRLSASDDLVPVHRKAGGGSQYELCVCVRQCDVKLHVRYAQTMP
ncbi:hypothetical protein BCR39DRAFT_552121 [Naematelia encephala]|uniref:Uncharacterized protein n=1 Tax=Naematelia encephala TaxID=71784 RepID=A0A1Y2AHX0_9TREE|nr:hypothetical protein BCR39DRAFT_552121 [Naematelia encephala]